MRKITVFLTAIAAALLFAGCQTDYSNKAADTARTYALKKLKGLNEEQRHFLRFTQPVLYSNLIFPRTVVPLEHPQHVKKNHPSLYPVAPHQDMMHHCFVWSPPGLNGKVVVVGEGERSLRFWKPYRVIVKEYIPGSVNFNTAVSAAVDYAMDKMLFLKQSELNRIRFSEPEVVYTDFEIALQTKAPHEDKTPWEEYLAEQNAQKALTNAVLTQISLVWKGDKNGEMIVISGFSKNGTLYGWHVQTGNYIAKTELDRHTLTPAAVSRIVKDHGPLEGKVIHPVEPKINRGRGAKESGSIFGGQLKF